MKKIIPLVAVSILSAALAGAAYAADDVQDKQKELVEKQKDVAEAQQELKQEAVKAADERVHVANESMQQISRASKIIGTKVKSPTGESLGDIKELVVDPLTGQVVYAVVSFGGWFGLGNKLFALPWSALNWARDKEYYVLDLDKDTLKKAPGFDKKHWPDSTNKWDQWREEIEQFYRVKP
ncbi:MAG: PRC-barrel domain-containing protein [Methylovulum miyakonense]|uniref:PRC-barrel domain-containing protein n=1 Tax=Methylovulum miyakonense TaxID=645578 RepID=UPI003BB77F99